ncbi:MAG: cytochrome c maturation protein CcmE [Myxococcales bacterium]|nr:cytochrome c maturation protein CcmE [Myxococcales bacterium]MCB9705324.1 cytochrome c maturation protein CcmE [Myxococcales bacterium]
MALPLATKAVLGLALAGAVAYLVMADEGEGVLEYVYVDKVMAAPADYVGRTIKVHGTVVPGTIRQKVGSSGDYTFEIEREGKRLAVHYTNMVPDTFAEGGEVVLTGQLPSADGVFTSDEMAAKCPSKYEEEPMAERR